MTIRNCRLTAYERKGRWNPDAAGSSALRLPALLGATAGGWLLPFTGHGNLLCASDAARCSGGWTTIKEVPRATHLDKRFYHGTDFLAQRLRGLWTRVHAYHAGHSTLLTKLALAADRQVADFVVDAFHATLREMNHA